MTVSEPQASSCIRANVDLIWELFCSELPCVKALQDPWAKTAGGASAWPPSTAEDPEKPCWGAPSQRALGLSAELAVTPAGETRALP